MAEHALDALGGWSGVLARVIAGDRLTSFEASAVMRDVLDGNATTAQLAGFLCVLRARGETVDELAGLCQAMLEASTSIDGIAPSLHDRLIDTCGTGGDRSGTINVSTMAALVVSAAGVPVCKHGNRASSSQTGTADVLEQLGVAIDLGPQSVVACVEQANMGFCMAPRFHPAMRYAGPIRKELSVPTAFNFMGPLANPAGVRRQVIGVSDPRYASVMLGVLQARGALQAMVVFGHDGLDELTTTTLSTVHELRDGEVRTYEVDPTRYGLPFVDPAALKGGLPAENAERVRRIVGGEPGPQADIVILNAAAALVVGGVVDDLSSGVDMARSILSDGRAAESLERLVTVSRAQAAAESADAVGA
jgi:anthranilate phosphoribosyltransferase